MKGPFIAYIDTEEGLKEIILRGTTGNSKAFFGTTENTKAFFRRLILIRTIVLVCLNTFFLSFITIAVCIRNRNPSHHRQSDEGQQQNRQEGESAAVANTTTTRNTDSDHTDSHIHSETKIIFIHSLCYFLAMLITDILPRMRGIHPRLGGEVWIDKLYYFFLPLQGFFNFLIFVGSKILWFRMVQPDLTVVKALNQMFCNPKPDPVVMTSLDMVEKDRQKEAERIRMIELREAQRIDDESSKTPSRANTNDENVEFVTRDNIDRHGMRRVGQFMSTNTTGVDNSLILVDAAGPTARNVGDQGLNETGLLKEDKLLISTDDDDIESIHNNTTSNQNTGINECTGSNNVAATSNHSPSRIDNRTHMAAYPESSQGSFSNSLGGFTNIAEEC